MKSLNKLLRAVGWLCIAWAAFVLLVSFWPVSGLVGIIIVCAYIKKRGFSNLWVMGTARWASAKDLARCIAARQGILLGRLMDRNGPLVRINPVATCIYAPVGAGKSQGVFVPWLLENNASAVVIDGGKGELARASLRVRRKMGRVVRLDPFGVVTQKPDSFNPFDAIPRDDPILIDACRDLAEALVVRTGQEKEPHWNDSAQFIIQAACCFVARYAPDTDRSLQTVRDIISAPLLLKKSTEALQASTDFGGLLARMGNQLTAYQDKELSSVLSTINRHLSFLDSFALQACTKASTFDPAELKWGKMTVFLILPPEHMRAQSALLRMWISSLLRAVVRQGLDESRKVWWLLDEAASLGHMAALDDLIERYRGYGCRSIWALQSRGQLKLLFPEGRDITFESNTTSIYLATQDLETATHVSNKLGEYTTLLESGGSSHSSSRTHRPFFTTQQHCDGVNVSDGTSSNLSQTARKLLKTEEALSLNKRMAVTFTPECSYPILTHTVRAYEEPGLFQPRLFSGFRASVRDFCKAAAFMIAGFVAAWALTVFALEREQYRPPVQQPAYYRGGDVWQNQIVPGSSKPPVNPAKNNKAGAGWKG